MHNLNKLVRGSQDDAIYQGSRPRGIEQDVFMFSLYMPKHVSYMVHAPWQPCFSTNQNNLNKFGRGSPKDHLCQIILKSDQWLLAIYLKLFLLVAMAPRIMHGMAFFKQL